jgi:hypothetical protein
MANRNEDDRMQNILHLRWLVSILHELLMWGHRLRHRRKSWSEISRNTAAPKEE